MQSIQVYNENLEEDGSDWNEEDGEVDYDFDEPTDEDEDDGEGEGEGEGEAAAAAAPAENAGSDSEGKFQNFASWFVVFLFAQILLMSNGIPLNLS